MANQKHWYIATTKNPHRLIIKVAKTLKEFKSMLQLLPHDIITIERYDHKADECPTIEFRGKRVQNKISDISKIAGKYNFLIGRLAYITNNLKGMQYQVSNPSTKTYLGDALFKLDQVKFWLEHEAKMNISEAKLWQVMKGS